MKTSSLNKQLLGNAATGDIAGIDTSLAKGASLKAADGSGNTALLLAVHGKHLEALKYLLQKGANPNQKRKDGATPLHLAAHAGNIPGIEALLAGGADPDLSQNEGNSPLTLAAAAGNLDAVRALLKGGANPWHKNRANSTVIAIASSTRQDELLCLLLEAAKKFTPPSDWKSIFSHSKVLLRELLRWKLHRANEQSAYYSLRELHISTSAKAHELAHAGIKMLRPPKPLPTSNGMLGNLSQREMEDISAVIRDKGYYVFPKPLEDAWCDRLLAYATQTPARLHPVPTDGPTHRVYNRIKADAPQYAFEESELIAQEDYERIVTDHSVLSLTQTYLECQPVLKTFSVWWSTTAGLAVDKKSLSQLFHFDSGCFKILHFFIYLTDVNTDTGPHQFVTPSHRAGDQPLSLLEAHGGASLTEAAVRTHYGADQIVEIHGRRGTILAVDSRGLHRGKPVMDGDRLILSMFFADSSFPLLAGQKVGGIPLKNDRNPRLVELMKTHPRIFARYGQPS